MGKRRRRAAWLGGAAPPFSFVPGKFVSSALLRARQVALLTAPTPTPAFPGRRAGSAGHREPGHRLTAMQLSARARLGPGKSSGELPRLLCALGEKLRPGMWDLGLAGRQAGRAVRSQGAQPRWERVWRGLCPRVG